MNALCISQFHLLLVSDSERGREEEGDWDVGRGVHADAFTEGVSGVALSLH